MESLSGRFIPAFRDGWPNKVFFPVMIIWCILAYGIAIVWHNIGQVFEFLGALGGATFSLLIPALFLVVWGRQGGRTGVFVAGIILAAFAIILALASIGVSTWTLVDPPPLVANCTVSLINVTHPE